MKIKRNANVSANFRIILGNDRMKIENLIVKGRLLNGWEAKTIADLGDIKARLFHLTPDKEMVEFEKGHFVNEWILVLSGEVILETPQKNLRLTAGDSFIVPLDTLHRLNVQDEPAVVLIIRDMKKEPANEHPGSFIDRIKPTVTYQP